jgi:hypothetical protein
MSAEARRRLLQGLGVAAFLVQCRMCARLVGDLLDSFFTLREGATAHMLMTRTSQLKPLAFKYPFSWVYGLAFLTAVGALLVGAWGVATWRALRSDPGPPGG